MCLNITLEFGIPQFSFSCLGKYIIAGQKGNEEGLMKQFNFELIELNRIAEKKKGLTPFFT